MELIHVLAMFRHGDRSPIRTSISSKLNTYKNERSFWKQQLASEASRQHLNNITKIETDQGPPLHGGVYPFGHLTQRGVDEMAEKGREFRRQYAPFLNDCNPHDQVYVCSTNIRRTILSAQSLLWGLFPEDATVEKRLVIHALEVKHFTPIHSSKEYQHGAAALKELAMKTKPNFAAFEANMKRIVGIPEEEEISWLEVREVLECRRIHNLALPEGLTEELYEDFTKFCGWVWFTFYSEPSLGQPGFRFAMERFQELMRNAVEKAPELRLTLISAHDNSLVALLSLLLLHHSIESLTPPPYGSMLVFEIYLDKDTSTHHVAVRWDGKPLRFPGQTSVTFPFDAIFSQK